MPSALPTLLTSLALAALVEHRIAPDHAVSLFADSEEPVPFALADPALGGQPRGLLLWAADARAAGIDGFRCQLVHPSLPYAVPRVDRALARPIARAGAVIVAEAAGTARAVLVLDDEGGFTAAECAPVPYAPLFSASAAEAVRELRQTVMEGLGTVERLGRRAPEAVRGLAWRDWQADMGGPGLRDELSALLPDPAQAMPLHAALDIHDALSPILAPATLEPPELGHLLARLHPAAADVVATITRGV
ncbi:hypothetical protein GSY69_02990 [Brevibacterium sp. 5221]|uniref:Uncharacterized protein n=1 Tax=Brevibacterium rongguiense TaxID=2695267 RepID=A0A6N9H4M6_9MICO|nr:hypothetical protein [Brevibacterium rongguiense]MYM18970.1 hypothetical protein [Brevibacterium rongguiense]